MEMEGTRKEIAQQNLEEDEELMHGSPERWWYHKQVKENMHRLPVHERLGMLVQEADQELMDVGHFTLAYDYVMTTMIILTAAQRFLICLQQPM